MVLISYKLKTVGHNHTYAIESSIQCFVDIREHILPAKMMY